MRGKRLIYILVVCGVLLLGGCGAVVGLYVVPALAGSGIGESFAAAFRLSAAVNGSGLVDGANVKFGRNVVNGQTTRLLTIECHWLGSEPADETAATRVAAIVLDQYDRISEVDRLVIAFVNRAQVGPVNLRQAQSFSHTPVEWQARRQRLTA
jgi:hypothetical protein